MKAILFSLFFLGMGTTQASDRIIMELECDFGGPVKDKMTLSVSDSNLKLQHDDCSTLPEDDPRHCIKLEGYDFSTWMGGQNLESLGYSKSYVIMGSSLSDVDLGPSSKVEMATELVVLIGDGDKTSKFVLVSKLFDPSTNAIESRLSAKSCRVLSKE